MDKETLERLTRMSPRKLALLVLELQARLEDRPTDPPPQAEPIAIIGMGCRVPGAAGQSTRGAADFWRLLHSGTDAISDVPADRWNINAYYDPDPDTPGSMATRYGGFIDSVSRFDARFFGISPREAASMDPHQRVLLEVAYEALEDAGQPLETLAGTQTGVFVGIYSTEYGSIQHSDPHSLDVYAGTGNALSVAAGRLAYLFDLHGPAVPVDTACSSSLLALHLACQSLRAGECDMALAGGINLLLTPLSLLLPSKMRLLAPDGRCKTFDARADGMAMGEGCGVVVLKPLSAAQRDNDRILALVRGSAANQDGRSNGLTAPNMLAQQDVIRRAVQQAGIVPAQVGYVEAHGTGTPLGDPIELEALTAVYGQERTPDNPLAIGSVKTNVGHLGAAAGITGLIKAVLCLQQQAIPPHLHLHTLNPTISLDSSRFQIPDQVQPWPARPDSNSPRYAAVSSFGWSGTNTHAILSTMENAEWRMQNADGDPQRSMLNAPCSMLTLSARSPEALPALAHQYHTWLGEHAPALADLAYTLTARRSHHPHRLACVASSPADVAHHLAAYLADAPDSGCVVGEATPQPPGIVFVFPGQGSQWLGMGRQLLEQEPVFRASIERSAAAFQPYVTWSLLDVLTDGSLSEEEQQEHVTQIDVIQPTLFAMQIALAALWQAWGIQPEAVIGHSMGEIAAAHIAGALSLEAAARIICRRSRLLRRMSGQGAMAVVELSLEQASAALRGYEHLLSIAVSNSPRSTVLAGDPAALDTLLTRLEAQGVFCRRVRVDVASHSPQMDALRDDLLHDLSDIAPQESRLPIYSTVTASITTGSNMGASYWASNLRDPVRFAAMVQQLIADGSTTFIEISPHPILLPAIEDGLRHSGNRGSSGLTLPSLRRHEDERASLLHTLARLYTRGYLPDWQAMLPPTATGSYQMLSLPPYPWQGEHYWLSSRNNPVPPQGYAAPAPADPAADPAADPLQSWLYEVVWQPDHRPLAAVAGAAGTWLLLADSGGVAERLRATLAAQDERCVLLPYDQRFAAASAPLLQMLREIEQPIRKNGDTLRGIVFLWGLDTPPLPEDETGDPATYTSRLFAALHLVQALAQTGWRDMPRLYLLTCQTQPVASVQTSQIAFEQAPLWGLGSAIIHEHPELRCTRIDLGSASDEELHSLTALLRADDQEDQLALRNDTRTVARLLPAPPQPTSDPPPLARPNATYLIVGGLRGLGLAVARDLVAHGARHLVLLARRPPDEATATVLDELRADGADIQPMQADVSDPQQVAQVIRTLQQQMPPLRGVLHSAVVLDDGILLQQTPARFLPVLAPKIAGAWNLHQHTRTLPLDWFVVFSALTPILGSPGQGNYAAASAGVDALIQQRHALGLPALSINWGPWGSIGQAVEQSDWGSRLANRGIASLTPQQGLALFRQLLQQRRPQVSVMQLDLRQWQQFYPKSARMPLLAAFEQTARNEPGTGQSIVSSASVRQQVQAQPPGPAQQATLTAYIQRQLAAVLRIDSAHLDADTELRSLGFDSLMAVELRNRLEVGLELTLSVTLVWSYPTVAALSSHLLEQMQHADDSAAAPSVAPAVPVAAPADDLLSGLLDDLEHTPTEEVRRLLGGGGQRE